MEFAESISPRKKRQRSSAYQNQKKHEQAKADSEKNNQRQQSFKEALKHHRAYRMEVVEAFLRNGTPLAKIDGLRPLLERNAFSLTSCKHKAEHIPTILVEEKKRLKDAIAKQPISIIFDGNTRLGEAIAVVVRYVDSWTLKQVLVRLHTASKPVTAGELTRFINTTLSVEYQIDGPNVVAAMRDGAAVNGAAMRNLTILYPNVMDITCFLHTAKNTSKHFQFETLQDFGSLWINLFSHSAKGPSLECFGSSEQELVSKPTQKRDGGRSGRYITKS